MTPFAAGFYERCGYIKVGAQYKLIKQVAATKEVHEPIPINAKSFLMAYFDSYGKGKLLSMVIVHSSKVAGLVVGKENRWRIKKF